MFVRECVFISVRVLACVCSFVSECTCVYDCFIACVCM